MDAPNQERRSGFLRVPVLPDDALGRAPEAPPVLPVLRGPAARRRTQRTRGAAVWLVVLAAAAAVAGVLIAKPFSGGHPHPAAPAPRAPRVHTPPAVRATRWGPLRAIRLPALPVTVSAPAGVRAGAQLVLVGGSDVLAGPVAGPLRRVAVLPSARTSAAAVASGTSVWVVGGQAAGGPTDEMLRLNLRSHRLTAAGRFEEPLAQAGSASAHGSLYLVGGWTGKQYATAILRFTPPSRVQLVARLPVGLRAPAVALVGARLYVAGGLTASGPVRSLFAVDVHKGTVSRLSDLPRAVSGAVLVHVAAGLYLVGGPTTDVVRIDLSTGRTAAAGKTSVALPRATAVSVGRAAIVFAGRTPYRLER